jgi:hypothetical protein
MHVVSETPPKYKTLIKLDLPQMKLKRTKSNSKEILTIQQKKLQYVKLRNERKKKEKKEPLFEMIVSVGVVA